MSAAGHLEKSPWGVAVVSRLTLDSRSAGERRVGAYRLGTVKPPCHPGSDHPGQIPSRGGRQSPQEGSRHGSPLGWVSE